MPLQRRLPKRGFRPVIARRVRGRQPRRSSAAFPAGSHRRPRRAARARPGAQARARQVPRRRARSPHALTVRAHAFSAQRARARSPRRAARPRCSVLEGFSNASRIPELRKRLLFTAAALAVYRLGCRDPDARASTAQALAQFFAEAKSNLLGLVNLFSGGALERFSIFALGIMPYISASIILQLLTVVDPVPREALRRRASSGGGRSPSTRATARSCCRSSRASSSRSGSRRSRRPGGGGVVFEPGLALPPHDDDHAHHRHRLHHVARRADHRARHRQRHLAHHLRRHRRRACRRRVAHDLRVRPPAASCRIFAALFIVVADGRRGRGDHLHRARRSGASRSSTRSASSAGGCTAGRARTCRSRSTPSGVIPPIFASSILLFPATIAELHRPPGGALDRSSSSRPGRWLYNLVYVGLIIFFCYFYTAVTFNPVDVADNLKKFGGYIPGIRPGPADGRVHRPHPDAHHARRRALRRGRLRPADDPDHAVQACPFYFGGTALLIVVGVALDTVAAIETHLITRNYEGFMKRGRIRGRR